MGRRDGGRERVGRVAAAVQARPAGLGQLRRQSTAAAAMSDPSLTIRLLVIENDGLKALAIQRAMSADGLVVDAHQVNDERAFVTCLRDLDPDVIISHLRPAPFSGYLALELTRSLKPNVVFIFVCDSINEDAAVEGLRRGATDYVLKAQLPRLAPITRRALAEATERKARERAEKDLVRAQRYESLALLASGLSHDLRNVLQPILMCSAIFAEDSDVKMQKAARMVEECAQRGLDIVTSMLSFAKGSRAARERVDIDALLEALDALVRGSIPNNIAFRVNAPEDGVELDGNYTELQQCLLNLALNAMQAMPNGGDLQIRVAHADLAADFFAPDEHGEPGRYLNIQVQDTGIGMSRQDMTRLFDPFFTTKSSGTGLGLFSCRRIISNHNGFMRVDSKLGKGTVFSIYLPQASISPTSSIDAPALLGHGETILVVVERAGKLSLLHDALELQGYNLVSAQSGAAAVRILRSDKHPSAVLMEADLNLLTGVPTANALLECDFQGPVLMIAKNASGNLEELPPLRRIRFVDKPVNVGQVIQVLAEELRNTTPRQPSSNAIPAAREPTVVTEEDRC